MGDRVDGLPAYDSFSENAASENAAESARGDVVRRVIEIGAGRSVPIALPEAGRDVYVADPKVASAVIQTARRVYVTGLTDGSTTVLVSASDGRQVAVIEVRVTRDTGSLASALRAALPNSRISVRSSGDNVILSGTVTSSAEASQALDIARGFVSSPDKAVNAMTLKARDQVMLKVTVAEVQRNVLKQLGVNGYGNWQIGDVAINAVMDNPLGVAGKALTNSIGQVSGQDGSLSISAMEQVGVARTLAEPTLTAISGETANFLVGGEVPIPTGITCASNNTCQPSIEFKKFGVSLTFTPVVLGPGRISLRVATEVSEIDNQNQLTYNISNNSSFTIPGFKIRKQETTVELPSGGTLVTAGLIQEGGRQAMTGVPGVMDIPVLGVLFRSRDYQRQETELMITVQPLIARPVEARQITRPDQGFADAPDPRAIFFGQVNRVLGGAQPPAPAFRPENFFGHIGFILD
ncbi:type II and III secretion system protein family protein [Xanthobacter sp. DSM 14520]|uniref:type II and III secretion system protein family protein n=1 Tax=Xanthobacter autotrophicus (strain ATCC BAA-1158 / Py2) TaxID=78245 RepID=UPI003727C3B3